MSHYCFQELSVSPPKYEKVVFDHVLQNDNASSNSPVYVDKGKGIQTTRGSKPKNYVSLSTKREMPEEYFKTLSAEFPAAELEVYLWWYYEDEVSISYFFKGGKLVLRTIEDEEFFDELEKSKPLTQEMLERFPVHVEPESECKHPTCNIGNGISHEHLDVPDDES